MKIAKISSKGQITIPKSIQRELKVAEGSNVMLYTDKGALKIKPMRKSITQQTAGSLAHLVPPEKRGIPFAKVREETHKLAAEAIVKKYERNSSR